MVDGLHILHLVHVVQNAQVELKPDIGYVIIQNQDTMENSVQALDQTHVLAMNIHVQV